MCKCCLCWRFSLGSLALPFGTHLVRPSASERRTPLDLGTDQSALAPSSGLVASATTTDTVAVLVERLHFFSFILFLIFSNLSISIFSLTLFVNLPDSYFLSLSLSFIHSPPDRHLSAQPSALPLFFFFFFSPESTPKSALRPSHSLSCDQAAALALQQFSLSSIQQQFPPLQQHFRFLIAPLHTHLITTLYQNVGILFSQTPLSYSPLFPPFALQTC